MSARVLSLTDFIYHPETVFETLQGFEAFFKVESLALKHFAKPSLPDAFLESLPYPVFSSSCVRRTYSIPMLNYSFYPTDLGLYLIANYYQHKYGFRCFIADNAKDLQEAFLFSKKERGVKVWGVISSQSEGLHVTPFLCFMNDKDELEIASIDSCQTLTSQACLAFHDLKKQEVPFTVFYPQNKRQIDSFSCRTDAISILKDAFLSLNALPCDSLKSFLESFRIEGSLQDYYIIPGIWLKGAQRSKAILEDPDKVMLPNSHLSLSMFLSKYRKLASRTDQIIANLKNPLKQELETVFFFEVQEFRVNLFLYIKAMKYALLIKSIMSAKE